MSIIRYGVPFRFARSQSSIYAYWTDRGLAIHGDRKADYEFSCDAVYELFRLILERSGVILSDGQIEKLEKEIYGDEWRNE